MGWFRNVLHLLLAACMTLSCVGCGESVVCGDGKIGGSEVCDGTLLGGETCYTKTGHQQGELACFQDCLDFDISGCHTCGDGSIEGPEVCDGQNLNTSTCLSLEDHQLGTPACNSDCLSFDVSGCYTCGNGLLEDAESCDGGELAGETCSTQASHLHGNVVCTSDCLGFDTSGCHTCDNGNIEGPEDCDGVQLGGQSCNGLNFNGGELLCGPDCNYDLTYCYDCGGMHPCDGIGCSLRGVCRVQSCTPACFCDPGYYAPTNELRCIEVGQPDPCAGQFCSGHGRCDVDAGGQAYCICDPGYQPGAGLSCFEPQCEHDRDCPPDQVCGANTCIAGVACNFDFNCDPSTEYCHPDGKVCKTRSILCEPCAGDYECLDPGMGDMCITYPNGDYCGQRCGVTACPPGYDCDMTSGSGTPPNPGQCRSNTGSCAGTFICQDKFDCAANQVCHQPTGRCLDMCTDDFQCPGGQKCHLSGHCGPPCAADSDCDAYASDLICCTAPNVPSQYCDADSVGKCRPDGCALHSECLQTQGDSLGYCDKRTHTCMPGCRAADLISVNDCKSGMTCECTNGTVSCDGFDCCPDPGAGGDCLCDPRSQDCSQVTACDNGECLPIPCYDIGDVSVACARNQLCCGWPVADGYTCTAGVNDGECYTVPSNIWCSSCTQEVAPCEVTGYGHGQPGACIRNSDDALTCHIGCRDDQDCPAGWQCDYTYIQGCNQQTDCEATALCDVGLVLPDGTELKLCMCQTDSDCPTDYYGFQAHCVEETLCDYSQNPPDCGPGMVCMFAKVCQCMNCCTEL